MKGAEGYFDEGFGEQISWGQDLLTGFEWTVVEEGASMSAVLTDSAPDWLIVYGYGSPISRSGWRWALRHRVRLAYIADSELRHSQSKRTLLIKRAVLNLLFRRVNAFLSVGSANEDYYRYMGVPDRKLVRMNFPIDLSVFGKPDPSGASVLRRKLDIPDSAIVVSTVGKLIERKRQSDLIAACRSFTEDEVCVVIVGSGPDEAHLESVNSGRENVRFAGFVPPSDLPAYYDLSDIYAQLSSYDPHPLAVSEAIAAGCVPIVSTSTGSWGPHDDVQPGRNGFVVRTGDLAAVRRAIADILSSPKLREEMGVASRLISAEHQEMAHGGFVDRLTALAGRG